MNIIQLMLRGIQFVWIILITSLIGNVIASAFSGNPSSINYAMFVAAFCWVVLFIGIAGAVSDAIPPIVVVISDSLAILFTFIAGVVLAAKLHVHSCGNNSYVTSNSLTNGSHDPTKRCHELQASTAFFWFLFVTFIASHVLTAMNMGGGFRRGTAARKGPAMTQV